MAERRIGPTGLSQLRIESQEADYEKAFPFSLLCARVGQGYLDRIAGGQGVDSQRLEKGGALGRTCVTKPYTKIEPVGPTFPAGPAFHVGPTFQSVVFRWIVLGAVPILLTFGCDAAKKAIDAGETQARSAISKVDPTGLIAETAERKAAAKAVHEGVKELDIASFNRAVADIGVVIRQLSERLDAISPQSLTSFQDNLQASSAMLRTKLEATDVDRVAATFATAAETFDAKIKTLNVKELNALVMRSDHEVTRLASTVTQLAREVDQVVIETKELVRQTTAFVRALPTDEARQSVRRITETAATIHDVASRLPATVKRVDMAMQSLRTSLWIASAVLVLLSACATVWLVGALRSRSG